MTTTDDWRDTWLEWRTHGIGASEIAAVCNVNPWDSPLSVYLRKRGELPEKEPTEAMDLGRDLEGFVADQFTKRTGLHVIGRQSMCQHPFHAWARATIDGFVSETPEPDPGAWLGVLETKTAGMLSDYDPLPAHVNYQVQWQLFVTEQEHAWVAVLGGGFRGQGFRSIEVARDEATIERLVDAGKRFWRDVQDGNPPRVESFHERDRDDLATAYPEPDPGTVVEIDEHADRVADLLRLKHEAKQTAEQIATAENALKAVLGDAEAGTVGGELAVTWKAVRQRKIDTKRLRAEEPALAERFEAESSYRRFLVR